ncbi:hypothetical protein WDJ50_15025 [Deinococcus sp. VB142]|uniref:Uncharacterized protein n=1 Tax=Deinococcus sp. VB142 TaxID=3112952 RepID=A0AAU6Q7N6_9DEIO
MTQEQMLAVCSVLLCAETIVWHLEWKAKYEAMENVGSCVYAAIEQKAINQALKELQRRVAVVKDMNLTEQWQHQQVLALKAQQA